MKLPIYMDNHATTPLDPEVLDAMLPVLKEQYGNAASANHTFGLEAAKLVSTAREQAASLIGADAKEIIFTSGTTESNHLAIQGVAERYKKQGRHVITQQTEHKAVLENVKALEKEGFEVTYLPVDKTGLISLEKLEAAITDQTILMTIMFANHEIGTIQPIAEIGALAKKHHVLFHVDAAQAVGKVPVQVEEMGIDLLSFSAHKMYGPKGVGALYVRHENPHVRLAAQNLGGGQEGGLRSGTVNVPGVVGLGAACEVAKQKMKSEMKQLMELRERLYQGLSAQLDEIHLNGHPKKRLPGNLNLSVAYVEGEALFKRLGSEIAISSGSACATGSLETSHILKALGLPKDQAHTAIRFGLGRFNTAEEVDYVIKRVVEEVKTLRALSPLYTSSQS